MRRPQGVLENTAFLCVFIKRPSLSVKTNVGVNVNVKVVRYPCKGEVNVCVNVKVKAVR